MLKIFDKRKIIPAIIVAIVMISGMSCNQEKEIPWSDELWKKGNLHTHSYWSDGDDYPEMIMDWYKDNSYQFVALSDHNILQEGEKWISVTQSPMRNKVFQKYLSKYGKDWVEYSEDSSGFNVRLKNLDEYRGKFEDDNFLILKSEEITSSFEGKPIHVNATNIQELIPGQSGESTVEVMQNVIDAVLDQRERTGIPMVPHINHPNFGYAISIEDMKKLEGERFFEVYNGHPAVNNYGNESHPGMEEMWDAINIHYLKNEKPIMYGIATDDSHNYHLFGSQFANTGRGWIMVNSVDLTPEALIDAMENGHFYSSSGVEIQKYLVSRKGISFEIVEEPGIQYRIEFIGATATDQASRVLKESGGSKADYLFSGDELFVRARVISSKLKVDPYQVGEFEMAWTQPVSLK